MKKVYDSIIETIGSTPIVKLKGQNPSIHSFFGKLEYFNPGGSIKDRVAVAIIDEAEKRGHIKPGATIIEATSGNTGVGLAMVAALRGYKCIFVMPDKISEEKRALLRAYGAKVVITPTGVDHDSPESYLNVCLRLVKETPNSFHANQYHNPDNPTQHYKMTGPELWQQMDGQIDVFVAGGGTGGTISGVGRYLKEKNPNVKIVLADPVGSILYDLVHFGKVIDPPQPYKVEGVGEDMLPDNVHLKYIDDSVRVSDKQAFQMTRHLAANEGLCLGPSSAMTLVAAQEFSKKLKTPANIVVLFPDNGRGYLSKVFNDQWMQENNFL
jgi:cystathionine beta-synthase